MKELTGIDKVQTLSRSKMALEILPLIEEDENFGYAITNTGIGLFERIRLLDCPSIIEAMDELGVDCIFLDSDEIFEKDRYDHITRLFSITVPKVFANTIHYQTLKVKLEAIIENSEKKDYTIHLWDGVVRSCGHVYTKGEKHYQCLDISDVNCESCLKIASQIKD